eukprot:4392625-Heterocapsa_arctica.AAC.1
MPFLPLGRSCSQLCAAESSTEEAWSGSGTPPMRPALDRLPAPSRLLPGLGSTETGRGGPGLMAPL